MMLAHALRIPLGTTLAVVMFALLVPSAPVGAQQWSPDVARCIDKDRQFSIDEKIAACTTVIGSGQYRGKDLAWAYTNRGIAHRAKSDYDRAIADYTEALSLDPSYTTAFYNRAILYSARQEYDRAIADFTFAINLTPPSVTIYAEGQAIGVSRIRADYFAGRGNAYHRKGDRELAIADLRESVRLDSTNRLATDLLRQLGVSP